MNKKVRELAIEAGYLPDNFGVGHWDMPEFNKFAESIVQECYNIVLSKKTYSESEIDFQCSIGADIKKHFTEVQAMEVKP